MKAQTKLSDDKIMEMELWAENKKNSKMTDVEKKMVSRIETYKKNNWRGVRMNSDLNISTKEEAQENLDRLKRK